MRRALLFLYRYFLGLLGCLYLVTLGIFRRDHRETLHEVAFRLGLRTRPAPAPSGPPLNVPEVNLGELLAAPPAVTVLEQDAVDGNVTAYELWAIAQLTADRKPSACFEIGTFDGRTTLNLAVNGGPGCKVYTLDLPPEQWSSTQLGLAQGDTNFIRKESSGTRFVGTAWATHITQLYGDSASFDYAPYEGKMDLVFIDGSHSYDYVMSDTKAALQLLKPAGGLVLWHDYGSPYWKDLTRALNDLFAKDPTWRTMRHVRGTTLVVWRQPA